MQQRRILLGLLLLTVLALPIWLVSSCASVTREELGEAEFLALTRVSVVHFDPTRVLPDQTVLVRGGEIVEVGPSVAVEVPSSARVVEGRGRFLLPAYAEMHGHLPRAGDSWELSFDDYFDLHLAAGITTIRTMRGALEDLEVRAAIEEGRRSGPRLVIGSPGIDGTLAPTPAVGRERVREYAEAGFDFLKILEGFDTSTFEAIHEESQRAGVRLAGHLSDAVSLERALETFWTIEHLHGHGAAALRDPEGFSKLARRTAASESWVCPTLGFQVSWYGQESIEDLSRGPGIAYVPPAVLREWTEAARNRYEEIRRAPEESRAKMTARRRAVRTLSEAGAKLIVSSSGGWFLVPGFSLFVEFRELVASGMTPEQVLAAATVQAAKCVGQEKEWGRVAKGFSADLVLLGADPLVEIRNSEEIEAVIRRGEYFSRSDLDRILARLAMRAKK